MNILGQLMAFAHRKTIIRSDTYFTAQADCLASGLADPLAGMELSVHLQL